LIESVIVIVNHQLSRHCADTLMISNQLTRSFYKLLNVPQHI